MANPKLKVGATVKILPTNTLLFDATGKLGIIDSIDKEFGTVMVYIQDMALIQLLPAEFEVINDI